MLSATERHKVPFIRLLLSAWLLEVFLFLSQSHYVHYRKLICYTDRALSAAQRKQEATAHFSHDGLLGRWIAKAVAGTSGKSWVYTDFWSKSIRLFTWELNNHPLLLERGKAGSTYVEEQQQSPPSCRVRQLHAVHANPFPMAQISATWGRGSCYWEHLRFSLTAQAGFVTVLVQSFLKPADETSPAAANTELSSALSPLLQTWGDLRPAQCTHRGYVLYLSAGPQAGCFCPLREAVVQRRESEPGLL